MPLLPHLLYFICPYSEKTEGITVFIFLNAISDLIKSRERFRGHANLMHNFTVIQTSLYVKSYVHKLKTLSASVGVCFSVNVKILQKSVLTQFIRKEYPCLFNFWSRQVLSKVYNTFLSWGDPKEVQSCCLAISSKQDYKQFSSSYFSLPCICSFSEISTGICD